MGMLWGLLMGVASAATYYVDATGGDDDNNGLTTTAAWQTVGKVNATTFGPGDNILFKRGEIWREELIINNSGTADSYITFGAYGSGEKPILTGGRLETGWTEGESNIWRTTVADESYLVYFDGTRGNKEAELVGLDEAYDWYIASASTTLYVYATADPDTLYAEVETIGKNSDGIDMWRNHTANNSYVKIENFKIIDAGYAGIGVDYSTGIIIENVEIDTKGRMGIRATNNSDLTISYATITSPNESFSNQTDGIYSSDNVGNSYLHNNIVLGNTNPDQHTDCIQLNKDNGGIIAYNYVKQETNKGANAQGIYGLSLTGTFLVHHNIVDMPDSPSSVIGMYNNSAAGGLIVSFYNNLAKGVSYRLISTDTANVKIKNNILINNFTKTPTQTNARTTLYLEAAPANHSEISNNIHLTNYPDGLILNNGGSTVTFATWQGLGADTNGTSTSLTYAPSADNTFAPTAANDLSVDAGVDLSAELDSVDYSGEVRPDDGDSSGGDAEWDVGPYEYQTVPTLTLTSPSSPISYSAGNATLSLTTSENATCRYGTIDTVYSSLPNTFSTTGEMSHSQALTDLSRDGSHNYYMRCLDVADNESDSLSYSFTFSVSAGGGVWYDLLESTSTTTASSSAIATSTVASSEEVLIQSLISRVKELQEKLSNLLNKKLNNFRFVSYLQLGSSGEEVSKLQEILKEENFYNYPTITGYFGSITQQAVRGFQKANGLPPVGVVGPLTRGLLNNIILKKL